MLELAFALVVEVNGIVDKDKTLHFISLQDCRWMAQELMRTKTYYQPVSNAYCKPVWVEEIDATNIKVIPKSKLEEDQE